MIFFPFRSTEYKTTLSPNEIFSRLREGLNNSEAGQKDVLEMTQTESSFEIGKSTGTSKRSLMDTEPVVKGKLKKENGSTSVKIAIQPRSLLLPAIGLMVIIPAVYFGVTKFDFLTFLLAILLIIMICSDLVIKFNRWYGVYMEILESAFHSRIM